MKDQRRSWLLIDAMDPEQPCVLAVGQSQRSAKALTAVLRGPNCKRALDTVSNVANLRTGASEEQLPQDLVLRAEPIVAEDGHVPGVWLGIFGQRVPLPDRGPVLAFRWNVTKGLTESEIGVAERLHMVDYGTDAGAILSVLAAPRYATGFDSVVLDRNEIPHQRFRVRARIDDAVVSGHVSSGSGSTDRFLSGLSIPLPEHVDGPIDGRESHDGLVAQASSRVGVHRAVVRSQDLELLHWYDEPPTGTAWRYRDRRGKSLFNPIDMTSLPSETRPETAMRRGTVRLLHQNGQYQAFHCELKPIPDVENASLATFTVIRRSVA
ncbi:GAF domain-containing protein [Rhodococcus sp. 1168]|uniref:GAF domain-containing protein n=1 Tax=Rhodococcus sp. 1168 TaxID=2018041 RepID=UPI000F736CCB|nr:GAF domain-containing protein [Rhodococcus sp. 1168]